MKTLYTTFYGCTNISYDNVVFKKNLSNIINKIWSITDNPQDADCIVLFSCGAVQSAEDQCIEKALSFSVMNKEAEIIISGCLPKINYIRLKETLQDERFKFLSVDEIYKYLGIEQQYSYTNYLTMDDFMVPTTDYLNQLELEDKWRREGLLYSANDTYIKISDGCLGRCSYCAIRFSRGHLKSRSIESILEELKKLNTTSIQHLIMIGSDCGAYGQDIGTNIISLMEKILNLNGNFKISFLYISPNWVVKYFDEFCRIFASGRVLYINVPVQSGSQPILSAMKRDYDILEVLQCLKYFEKQYPKLLLGTGVIVGFPGENRHDFERTIDFLEAIRFNTITYHLYSDRPRTEANKMSGKISREEMMDRVDLMHKRLEGKEGLAKLKGQDICR